MYVFFFFSSFFFCIGSLDLNRKIRKNNIVAKEKMMLTKIKILNIGVAYFRSLVIYVDYQIEHSQFRNKWLY